MSNWSVIKPDQIQEQRKVGPHKWRHTKSFHWEFCQTCGIIAVNNSPTRNLCRKLCGSFW